MDSSDLRRRSARELVAEAQAAGVDGAATMRRADLVVALLQLAIRRGDELTGDGVLEVTPDGFGFLRSPYLSYQAGADDVYVSPSQIRRFELRTGDSVRGVIRPPKEGERFVALLKVGEVNGRPPEARRAPLGFTEHEVAAPSRWLDLGEAPPLLRAVDLLAPLPAGGRALIVGPAEVRAALVADLAAALADRHADLAVHLVLLDQPREDLLERSAPPRVELAATALDEAPARHAQVAELALARAERMAEAGQHVVLLVESATALSRALHGAQPRPAGSLEPGAVDRVRQLLAAGRVLAGGGSLTVVARADDGPGLDAATAEALAPVASSTVRLCHAAPAGGLPLDALATAARRTDRYLAPDQHAARAALGATLAALAPADAARRVAELAAAHPSAAAALASIGPTG